MLSAFKNVHSLLIIVVPCHRPNTAQDAPHLPPMHHHTCTYMLPECLLFAGPTWFLLHESRTRSAPARNTIFSSWIIPHRFVCVRLHLRWFPRSSTYFFSSLLYRRCSTDAKKLSFSCTIFLFLHHARLCLGRFSSSWLFSRLTLCQLLRLFVEKMFAYKHTNTERSYIA